MVLRLESLVPISPENAPGDSLHAVRIPIGRDFTGEYPVLTFGSVS